MSGKRFTDSDLQSRIEVLIESEEDKSERARMLILLQMSTLLIDNITAVREIATEFKQHREDFENHIDQQERLYNRGWGIWKAVGVMAVIAQISITSALGWFWDQHKQLDSQIAQLQATVAVMKHSQ